MVATSGLSKTKETSKDHMKPLGESLIRVMKMAILDFFRLITGIKFFYANLKKSCKILFLKSTFFITVFLLFRKRDRDCGVP